MTGSVYLYMSIRDEFIKLNIIKDRLQSLYNVPEMTVYSVIVDYSVTRGSEYEK